MAEQNDVEEIIKLINKGFDIELIAFELDIPIERIKQYELEAEKRKNQAKGVKKYQAKEIIYNENKRAHSRMQQMREKYQTLLGKEDIKEEIKESLLIKDEEFVKKIIMEIESKIEEIKQASEKDTKNRVNCILKNLKKIQNYQLNTEQARELQTLLEKYELNNLKFKGLEKNAGYIKLSKKIAIKKLAETIDRAQAQTEEIEELKRLDKMLNVDTTRDTAMNVKTVKDKIRNKIFKIKQQKVIDIVRNDIPADIEQIICDISRGKLDIKQANVIIDVEAQKRVEGKIKNKFTLTKEQERRQILIQIKKLLADNAEKYYIEKPDTAIQQIQELCEGELEQAIRTIVKNLISKKDFERAKKICEKYSSKEQDETIASYVRSLKKEIRNAEIADMVLKGINMNGTETEEKRFLEMIEKGLRAGNIKPNSIILGKSKNGFKNISLEDIWMDEEKESPNR